jgi:Lon protease-like protein
MKMKAGNASYSTPADIPAVVPVFPLSGALLLPGGQMPLNIFEPRYLAMIDDALGGDRLIGMVQPKSALGVEGVTDGPSGPALCELGCLGRITAFQESGDGRYLINLSGVARYRIVGEEMTLRGYRRARVEILPDDLQEDDIGKAVDRGSLLETFRKYLKANNMEADWDSIKRASNGSLVTALCMMSPYGPAEKQALLEACDLRTRAETLIAITEIALARGSDEPGSRIQ